MLFGFFFQGGIYAAGRMLLNIWDFVKNSDQRSGILLMKKPNTLGGVRPQIPILPIHTHA